MQFFFGNCSQINKNAGGKFDNMFLVEIANKGTFLNAVSNNVIPNGLWY